MRIQACALICCGCLGAPVWAAGEAEYAVANGRLSLPAISVDNGAVYSADLELADAASFDFVLRSAAASAEPGVATYASTQGEARIPSVVVKEAGGAKKRYQDVVLRANGERFRLAQAIANNVVYADSAEAAKVAPWVRDLPPVGNAQNHFSAIGIMHMNSLSQQARNAVIANGPDAFYSNGPLVAAARQDLVERMRSLGPALQAGGITHARDVQNLPWGMIEPRAGTYRFDLSDQIVATLQDYGVNYVGVVMPYAGWDLASRGPAAGICSHFFSEDFFYLAKTGAMDRYTDLAAFLTQLGALVKRYDGDGKQDMPGLRQPIRHWQIHNEPEGTDCGGFGNDVAAFVDLMRQSSAVIKATCTSCQVLNGGAGLTELNKTGGGFWKDFAALGGAPYVDIIAVHYNEGKQDIANDSVELFEQRIAAMKNWLGDKPVWLTEFGVFVGSSGGTQGRFSTKSETEAAAWFMRYYAAGLAQGVTRFFSDVAGFINGSRPTTTFYLTYYVNRMMENLIGGFQSSGKLASGQYRFIVNGKPVYVLWNGVPAALTGQVTYYDMYGTARTASANTLAPSFANPLIVVPM